MPVPMLNQIVSSGSVPNTMCWPLKQRSIVSNLPVFGSYAASPLASWLSGQFCANLFADPVLHHAGCSARICELNQTRPFLSMCGWFGLIGSVQTISSPQNGDGASLLCGDHVRSFARSASTFIGTGTIDLRCSVGSRIASAPADQSGP